MIVRRIFSINYLINSIKFPIKISKRIIAMYDIISLPHIFSMLFIVKIIWLELKQEDIRKKLHVQQMIILLKKRQQSGYFLSYYPIRNFAKNLNSY